MGAEENKCGWDSDKDGGGEQEVMSGKEKVGEDVVQAGAKMGVGEQDVARKRGIGGELGVVGGGDGDNPGDEADGLAETEVAEAEGGPLVGVAAHDGEGDQGGDCGVEAAGGGGELVEEIKGEDKQGSGKEKEEVACETGGAAEVDNGLRL